MAFSQIWWVTPLKLPFGEAGGNFRLSGLFPYSLEGRVADKKKEAASTMIQRRASKRGAGESRCQLSCSADSMTSQSLNVSTRVVDFHIFRFTHGIPIGRHRRRSHFPITRRWLYRYAPSSLRDILTWTIHFLISNSRTLDPNRPSAIHPAKKWLNHVSKRNSWFYNWLVDWFIDWLINWIVCLMIDWLIDGLFIWWLVDWLFIGWLFIHWMIG